jgi:hypothetical protein
MKKKGRRRRQALIQASSRNDRFVISFLPWTLKSCDLCPDHQSMPNFRKSLLCKIRVTYIFPSKI